MKWADNPMVVATVGTITLGIAVALAMIAIIHH